MSPRSTEALEAIHAARRAEILEAALQVFCERGFEGTRIQAIAARCGLSYGLVYHYFPDKEEVYAAIVDSALSAASALIEALPRGASSSMLEGFVVYALRDPAPMYFSVISEALSLKSIPKELSGKVRKVVLRLRASLSEILGSPAGRAEAADAVLALLLGASTLKRCGISDGGFVPRAVSDVARREDDSA